MNKLLITLGLLCLFAFSLTIDVEAKRHKKRNVQPRFVDPPPLEEGLRLLAEQEQKAKQQKDDAGSMSPDCVGYLTCGECIEAPECGWCASAQKCVLGSLTGPDYGICSTWDFTTCSNSQSSNTPSLLPTLSPSAPPSEDCPSAPYGIFGGYSYAGFCWYFADNAVDPCDVTCSNVTGGVNLAYEAENAFYGDNIPVSTDVVSVIYYQYDNPDNWNGPANSFGSCHTLGWYCPTLCSQGPGVYFGKDLTNTLACGTFPGEQNYPGNWVTPICACAYSDYE